jgi:DnaJ-class molecular chaperone
MATQLDCYGILQVHPKAEKEVIDAAYEVLSDPIKRAAYDA